MLSLKFLFDSSYSFVSINFLFSLKLYIFFRQFFFLLMSSNSICKIRLSSFSDGCSCSQLKYFFIFLQKLNHMFALILLKVFSFKMNFNILKTKNFKVKITISIFFPSKKSMKTRIKNIKIDFFIMITQISRFYIKLYQEFLEN